MEAFLLHLKGRENSTTIRYEGLVSDTDQTQSAIEQAIERKPITPFRDFYKTNNLTATTKDAKHGLRPLSTKPINRWKSRPENYDSLRSLIVNSNGTVKKTTDLFAYDLES